jgi:hypothetical protein
LALSAKRLFQHYRRKSGRSHDYGFGMSDQRARLPQLGSSSITIGTQFDKAFLDPDFVSALAFAI